MNILITNITLENYTGTEVAVCDLALGLKKIGHYPMVYSPKLGQIVQNLLIADIPVVSNLSQLTVKPDIIHGHHHIETVRALSYFPTTPGIFVCHDSTAWHDIPPKQKHILAYVAVDLHCYKRLVDTYQIPDSQVFLITNGVDTDRYLPRSQPLPATPKRALIYSNYAHDYRYIIQKACKTIELPLDTLGFGTNTGSSNPENFLVNYDLIFAKGRCALEALAIGASVICYDRSGFVGIVNSQNVDVLRKWSFVKEPIKGFIEPNKLVTEINKYNWKDSCKVTEFIRENARLRLTLEAFINLYNDVLSQWKLNIESDISQIVFNYRQNQLQQLTVFETMLNKPFQMYSLDLVSCAELILEWVECPSKAKIADSIQVIISFANLSKHKLGSYPPKPIFFAYHWLYSNTNDYFLFEGERTALEPWLDQGQQHDFHLTIQAPQLSGRYRLVVTLVQETVRWFDQIDPPVQLLAEIEVD